MIKASVGSGALSLPLDRNDSFTTFLMIPSLFSKKVTVIPNLLQHRRLMDSQLVKEEPSFRFYAGADLVLE